MTYFVPDERKTGGAYLTSRGSVRKVQELERLLVLDDGLRISMDDVVELEFL